MTSCRDECTRSGEPLAGSAGAVHALVAIAWPKPHWDPDEKARSRGLPPALADLEVESKAAGRKLAIRLFQRDERPSTEHVELIVARGDGQVSHARSVPLTGLVARLRAHLDDEAGDAPLARRMVLVCTDGKHDRCCATFGRPVLEALREQIGRRGLPCDVVESSHLGGHRFAANALVLPEGHLYGRIGVEDAESFADAMAADQVLVSRYRGRLDLSGAAQAAEACLRSRFPRATLIEPEPVTETTDASLEVHAQVQDADGARREHIELVRETFDSRASCADEAARTQTRWVPRLRAG